jgi:hypothetical protein
VPPLLAVSTVRVGLAAAMGSTVSPIVSAEVAALAESGVGSLLAKKASIAVVLLLSLALGIGGLLAHRAVQGHTFAEVPATPKAAPTAPAPHPARSASKEQAIEIKGRVLGPDGKPFAGARVFLLPQGNPKKPNKPGLAATDKEGRFRLTAHPSEFGPQGKGVLAATAKGLGPDWIEVTAEHKSEVTLRLVKDDVPIEARILDLEGRPISGVRVHVVRVKRGDLDAWMKVILAYTSPIPKGTSLEILGASASAITGKDGRFRLTGIGRERGVELRIQGPGIETAQRQLAQGVEHHALGLVRAHGPDSAEIHREDLATGTTDADAGSAALLFDGQD